MRREEIERLAERLDALLEGLQATAAPEVVEAVAELVDGLQRVHAEGLRRIAELLAEDGERFRRALDDPVVSNLFLLYDLVLLDERRRAEEALESVRSLARAHGGEIRLLDVEDGVVRVELLGACHGCPSSSATLRQGIERALAEKLPGFARLEVEGPDARAAPTPAVGPGGSPTGDVSRVPAENLVRLERRLERGKAAGRGANGRAAGGSPTGAGDTKEARRDGPPRRVAVAPLDELPARSLFGALVDGIPVLLVPGAVAEGETASRPDARAPAAPRAFWNACPGSILPLHLGSLEDGEIRCPWHGCRFDPAGGERLDRGGLGLERLESFVEGGRVWVVVPGRLSARSAGDEISP